MTPRRDSQYILWEYMNLATTPQPTAILIDDDALIHLMWNEMCKYIHKDVRCFYSLEEFLKNSSDLSRETPIYIDFNLSEKISGVQVAESLFEIGFKNLFLTTGNDPRSIQSSPIIKGIIGKYPPEVF